MVHLLNALSRTSSLSGPAALRVRAIRPSLTDIRFTGDPWVVAHGDGAASVCLGDYRLTTLALAAFDLPGLNRLWTELRHRSR